MIAVGEIGFLLLLLLNAAYGEEPELLFRAEGGVIEMGYCFGVDYIVVYRSAPEGDQLLGNSSTDATPSSPPADLLGRVNITYQQQLLGLQISHLTHSDSGVYRRECWQNKTLVNQHIEQVFVCNEEVDSEEIAVMEDGGTKLLCNSRFTGLDGATRRWYHEVFPSYKTTLFLDSNVSLEPLVKELQGVEVREGGALLHVPGRVLQDSHHFYCIMMKSQTCLSFQKIYLPDSDDVRAIYASQGDKVVLKCPSNHTSQRWDTPLGRINTTAKSLTSTNDSMKSDQIYISGGDKSESYSLVIPVVSDKHSGEYVCFSPALVAQYSLVLCLRSESREMLFFEGKDVLLKCEITQEESHRVQWHRRETLGEDSLIQDSKDKSVPIPKDLWGRVILSDDGSSLKLSGLTSKDAGAYWCVVLGGPEFLESDDDYTGDDEEEYAEEEEDYNDGQDWPESFRCISKQETILTVAANPSEDKGKTSVLVPNDLAVDPTPDPSTPDPSTNSNITAYAVGAALVGLTVAGVAAVVIIRKRRAEASPKQRGAASGSRLNSNKDIEMSGDPSCTERLAPKSEYDT